MNRLKMAVGALASCAAVVSGCQSCGSSGGQPADPVESGIIDDYGHVAVRLNPVFDPQGNFDRAYEDRCSLQRYATVTSLARRDGRFLVEYSTTDSDDICEAMDDSETAEATCANLSTALLIPRGCDDGDVIVIRSDAFERFFACRRQYQSILATRHEDWAWYKEVFEARAKRKPVEKPQ